MNKFNKNDWVRVNHPTCGTWEGEVTRIADTGNGEWEYWTTNAPSLWPMGQPVLAWEHEITLLEKAKC